ncbi:hypothetical protein H4R18_001227 [Coemansia javaensis]|uniref:Cytochrome P450 n=1 Tax=Coemansia javaensis TaxID=2761396 RepID=A0A9W8LLN5_9FUNG|nr:hypothetical protein H4R18_001227 [Coemansia javaensis]
MALARLWIGAAAALASSAARALAAAGLCAAAALAARAVYAGFVTLPLRRLPGPWYTKITGLERKLYAWRHREHHYFMLMFERYGPLVRVAPDKVGVGEVGMFRKMMASHDLTKSKMYSDFALAGENVFTTRSPDFNKIRRRQMGPAFAASHIHRMEPLIMAEGVDRLCQLFDAQIRAASDGSKRARAATNVHRAFTMMTTDLISSLVFGRPLDGVNALIRAVEAPQAHGGAWAERHGSSGDDSDCDGDGDGDGDGNDDCGGEKREPIIGAMIGTMLLMGLVAELPFLRWLPARFAPRALAQLYAMRDRYLGFAYNAVVGYRRRMARAGAKRADGAGRVDILGMLIAAEDPETGARMTDWEIASESTVLLAAGTDTSANVLANCVRLLLLHPDAMSRARAEVRDAFPDGAQTITYAAATERLPFLGAVIWETLRLRSSSSGAWPRDAPRAGGITLGGHYIPPGAVLYGSVGGANLNPDTWAAPKAFVPERFLGPAGEARRRDVVSFGSGVRLCPGRRLAMVEITMALSTLLHKYDFGLVAPPAADDDYYSQLEEVCHITTGFANSERDFTFYVSARSD